MESMKDMQRQTLSVCFENDGWPKPFIHISGVVQLAENQEDWDSLCRFELWSHIIIILTSIAISVLFALKCGG